MIYGSTSLPGEEGQTLLKSGVDRLLSAVDQESKATTLWSLRYTQLGYWGGQPEEEEVSYHLNGRVASFPPPCLDLAFDDGMLGVVRSVWEKVMGGEVTEPEEFMKFEDRNEEIDDDI